MVRQKKRDWGFIGAVILALIFSGCAKKFEPLLAKARKSYSQKNYVESIDALNLALRSWSDSDGTEKKAQASELLGKAYKEIGKYDKAMENFADAIQLSTNTYESAYSLGNLYLMASLPKNAVRVFKEALKMKMDDPMALVGLGNAYFALGDLTQAKVAYQRVIDTSPGVATSLEFLQLIDKKMREPKKEPKKTTKPLKKSRRKN